MHRTEEHAYRTISVTGAEDPVLITFSSELCCLDAHDRAGNEPSTSSSASASRVILQTRGDSSTIRRVQHESYSESIHYANDGSLHWGEKEANDGSWVEKWAVQTVDEPQHEPRRLDQAVQARRDTSAHNPQSSVVFGQSQGQNYRTNERCAAHDKLLPVFGN